MSVYPKLLLSAGGGIISTQQQADQMDNTATILIGLGGTGLDCLRTIKTQVYSRLRPDDAASVVPEYQHIRFIGVDTDELKQGDAANNGAQPESFKGTGLMSLDETEFFSIANPNARASLANEAALKIRRELEWLRWSDIPVANLTDAGAGGNRQMGRFMMMDKSAQFMSRLQTEINKAKEGLQSPRVMIHIFSGLSGGTGAGCFLDVCYMVRSLAKAVGGVTVFGYFFLPDVNLSRIPPSSIQVREYIPRNGYAALQELDYCMQLQFNGGSFTQEYQGSRKITWYDPPVDMCHLICATDSSNNVIPNAYDYAMNVTAEYVMDFLTKCADSKFQLTQHLANFSTMVGGGDAKKNIGSNLAYCVIGASCASIPLREINTYLASELFEKFSRVCRNVPTEQDVLALASSTMAPGATTLGEIYDAVYQEIRQNADDGFDVYPNDHKYAIEYGDKDLTDHYAGLLARKRGCLTSNAASMMDEENQQSLIRRVRSRLVDVLRDVDRGPIFGYRMLAASESHNLLNLINGLLDINQSLWDQASYNRDNVRRNYESARADFAGCGGGAFSGAKKKFETYLNCVTVEVQSQLVIDVYRTLDEVLRRFREQVVKATGEYYIKLSRVTENLIDTFAENRSALASGFGDGRSTGDFSMPMMTISELKPSLDDQIRQIDIPNMLGAFMDMMLANESAWLSENQYKITRLVTQFFIHNAFSNFANLTITAFLKDKYQIADDAQLANRVYNDWIMKLTDKADPLFYFNPAVWNDAKTTHICSISVPETSAPIVEAADKRFKADPKWEVKKSALTDRIFVMSSACVLPLSSYNNCDAYERDYFSVTPPAGIHYYEGKPISGGMEFNDWRQLPSLTPASLVNLSTMAEEMRERTQKAMDLYDAAAARGMFNSESIICLPSEASMAALRGAIDSWNAVKGTMGKAEDAPAAQKLLADLQAARKLEMVPSQHRMKNDGYAQEEADKLRVQRDHFVAAPAYQRIVAEQLAKMDALDAEAQQAADEIKKAVDSWSVGVMDLTNYCEALFSGVISVEGLMVVYHQVEMGVVTDYVLSKRDEGFPFYSIPFYQGYVNFQALEESVRKGIQSQVNDRLNTLSPEINKACDALKVLLSDDRVNSQAQQAAKFAQRTEIVDFLKKFKQEFVLFCQSNGI